MRFAASPVSKPEDYYRNGSGKAVLDPHPNGQDCPMDGCLT
jgi:hypothetical protein